MKHAVRSVCIVALVAGCQQRSSDREHNAPPPPSSSSMTSTPAPPVSQPTPPPAEQAPPRPAPPPLPDPLPGTRRDVTSAIGSAWRAGIGDLDGDGRREIVIVDSKELKVLDASGKQLASAPVTGGIQKLVVADIDGDKRAEILAGWGQTREHMDSKTRLSLHRLVRGALTDETVLAPQTSRDDVTAIVPMPDAKAVLFAYFDSKYMVTSVVLRRGATGWTDEKVATLRTANHYARGDVTGDGTPDLVVGRVYGDDKGIDGDAFVLAPDGARTKIPSTRGMRAIAVADADGDGHLEVFLADGWHQNYGQLARGLLTWARFASGAFTTELIEDTPGQFAIEKIVPATIDGKPAIVTLGSHYVRVFMRVDGTWRGLTIGGLMRDVSVGDLDGKPGDEILLVGDRSEVVSLHATDWPK